MLRSIFVVLVLASAASAQSPRLTDVAWLSGNWKSIATEKSKFEEQWSQPDGKSMMGMFRLAQGSGMLYEFLLLEEDADGVWMRFRHYRSQMVDVDQKPIKLKLAEHSKGKLVFDNPEGDAPKRITYELDAEQKLNVTVETSRAGKPAKFALKFERSKTQ